MREYYREKLLGIPTSVLMEKVMEDEDFIEKLVDKLMLDELLCGEADSVEFFKQSVKEVHLERRLHAHKGYVERFEKELKGEQ